MCCALSSARHRNRMERDNDKIRILFVVSTAVSCPVQRRISAILPSWRYDSGCPSVLKKEILRTRESNRAVTMWPHMRKTEAWKTCGIDDSDAWWTKESKHHLRLCSLPSSVQAWAQLNQVHSTIDACAQVSLVCTWHCARINRRVGSAAGPTKLLCRFPRKLAYLRAGFGQILPQI